MRLFFTAACLGATVFAAPALAWSETQPATNDMPIYAYPTHANYCPAGLQPVMLGGVICCGTPTHHGNPYAHPVSTKRHKPRHKPAHTFVSHGKGSGDVVVYEKGQ